MKIDSIDNAIQYVGTTNQAQYIIRYTKALGCKTIIVEPSYVDKDYLIDFSKFYARAFGEKITDAVRVHFFTGEIPAEKIKNVLLDGPSETLQQSYLGFTVVKPVKDESGEPIIGRTVLRTYNEVEQEKKRQYVRTVHRASLYGHHLQGDALPFQSQDIAVGACASAALWTVLHPLSIKYDLSRNSLFEITEMSNKYGSALHRIFPSKGLSISQMCGFLSSKGLEYEFFNLQKIKSEKERREQVRVAIRAYVREGLPIIAALELKNGSEAEHHAVVISGYASKGDVDLFELYVHDDRIGPYAHVNSDDGFLTWKYEPDEWKGYPQISLEYLIVPLYHKLRLPFWEVFRIYERFIEAADVKKDLQLFEVSRYKNDILMKDFVGKEDVLTLPMPHFIWVLRISKGGRPTYDFIYDATSPMVSVFAEVTF